MLKRGPMKWDTREPCENCPYRKDAKLKLWDPAEFENLLVQDNNAYGGAIFGCHGTAKLESPSVCGGWLLDQKRRNLPSIQLRLAVISSDAAAKALEAITDGGHKLYTSIAAMCRANGIRIRDLLEKE